MADIAKKVADIRTAIYGKDVRESIASGMEAMNEDCEIANSIIQSFQATTTKPEEGDDLEAGKLLIVYEGTIFIKAPQKKETGEE